MPDLEMPDISATLGDAYDAAQDLPEEHLEETPELETAAPEEDSSPAPADESIAPAQEAEASDPETAPTQTPARSYDEIEQILAPRREAFAMQGMNEAQALQQLFALSDFANRDPQAFIRQFAAANGVNLASEPEQPEGEPEFDEFTDPLAKQAIQELRELKREMAEQKQAQAQAQQAQQHAYVDQFAAEKDEQGNLLRPHFQQVRQQMAAFVQAGADLNQAYEQACWANPQIRGELLKAQEAERIAQSKAAAEKAARVAAQPRTESGQFASSQPTTMKDTMSAVYDRLNS